MAKYDITNEAIIDASPDVVYNALMDGSILEWLPLSAKRLTGSSYDEVGALTDITFHDRPIKYTEETVEARKNEIIRLKYVKGAFRGEGLWKLEKIDGKTKISFRFRVRHYDFFLRIIAPFVPIEKRHSDVMKAVFDGFNKYLGQKP
jgi:ribosome-associated toxin RatA of RatAB toxin-antitoxin module